MIKEQRELKSLAKALRDRGHTKQADVVSELSLVKEAAPPGAPDLNKLSTLWDTMIAAGWKHAFKPFIGSRDGGEKRETDAYKGQDTTEWNKVTSCVTRRYKSQLSGGRLVATKALTLEETLESLQSARTSIKSCEESPASTVTGSDGGWFGLSFKIKNVSERVEQHISELYDWQKGQPVMSVSYTHLTLPTKA